MVPLRLNVGDIIQLKKQHPCGEDKWEIMRTGVDFRIKCLGCSRQVWLPRRELERKIKKIIKSAVEDKEE